VAEVVDIARFNARTRDDDDLATVLESAEANMMTMDEAGLVTNTSAPFCTTMFSLRVVGSLCWHFITVVLTVPADGQSRSVHRPE
jgi:hypothetical protein